MALKKVITELEEVSETVREHYTEVEGVGYVLDLDGDESALKKKVDEFRSNNRKLHAERTAAQEEIERIKESFGGLSPEAAKKAKKIIDAAEEEQERKLLEAGDLDGALGLRTAKMQKKYQTTEKRLREARDTAVANEQKLRGQLGSHLIAQGVRKNLPKIAAASSEAAMEDIIFRTEKNFTIDDEGHLVARKGVYGEDGEPLKFEDHIRTLPEEAPHLFKKSKGGGGGGSDEDEKETKPGEKDEKGRYYVDASDPIALGNAAEDIATGKAIAR